jgi:hypothetical protein
VKYARENNIPEHGYPIFKKKVEKYCINGILLDPGCGFGSSMLLSVGVFLSISIVKLRLKSSEY